MGQVHVIGAPQRDALDVDEMLCVPCVEPDPRIMVVYHTAPKQIAGGGWVCTNCGATTDPPTASTLH